MPVRGRRPRDAHPPDGIAATEPDAAAASSSAAGSPGVAFSQDVLQARLVAEARQRRRQIWRLPTMLMTAVKMSWETNRWATAGLATLQLGSAAAAALQVLIAGYAARLLVQDGVVDVTRTLLAPLLLLAVVTAFAGLVNGAQGQLGRLLGVQVQRRVTEDVLDVSSRVDLIQYDHPSFHDHLTRVLATMPTQPARVVTSLTAVVGGLVSIVVLSVTLFVVSPLLAVILIAVGLPLWVLSRRGGTLEFDFSMAESAGQRDRMYLTELLSRREFAAEARAYGTAPLVRDRLAVSWDGYVARYRTMIRRRYRLLALSGLVTALAAGGALAALVLLIDRGSVSVGSAASAVVAIRLLSSRITQLFGGLSTLFQTSLFLDDFAHFQDYAREEPAMSATPAPTHPPGRPPVTQLNGVSFTYPNSPRSALTEVTLTIPSGQVVAIVGENGSGKSTLAKILAGLYAPTAGDLSWTDERDGVLTRDEVRRRTTLVLQDFIRYQLSASDNIALGRSDRPPDGEAVRRAASAARVHELIDSLPHGYDTRLSRQFTEGRELSLGQWQRVALARAFYRDGAIVILDEPAASLDPRSEHELYEAVRRLLVGRTVVLITHRLRSVEGADRILVMDEGRVVQDGSHDELLNQEGLYAEFIDLQRRGGLTGRGDGTATEPG